LGGARREEGRVPAEGRRRVRVQARHQHRVRAVRSPLRRRRPHLPRAGALSDDASGLRNLLTMETRTKVFLFVLGAALVRAWESRAATGCGPDWIARCFAPSTVFA